VNTLATKITPRRINGMRRSVRSEAVKTPKAIKGFIMKSERPQINAKMTIRAKIEIRIIVVYFGGISSLYFVLVGLSATLSLKITSCAAPRGHAYQQKRRPKNIVETIKTPEITSIITVNIRSC